MVRFAYDPDTDAIYINLNPDSDKYVANTEAVSDYMNVDLADDGTPLGIEIWNFASEIVDLSKLEVDGPIFGNVSEEDS
jgi:uncharacterized protein YuzE